MDFGIKSVSVPEAAELQQAGWTLVDVRLVDNFNYSHIEGSVSIPLYRAVQGDSMFDNIKRLAMASFAMKATGMVDHMHVKCILAVDMIISPGCQIPKSATSISSGHICWCSMLFGAGV